MKTSLIAVMLCITAIAFCQQRKIVGRIVDAETDKPISGVNIVIRGMSGDPFTNALGFFQLTFPDTIRTLIATHVSYVTSSIKIPKEDRFTIKLKKQFIRLQTVYVEDFPIDTAKVPVLICRDTKSANQEGVAVIESPACPPQGMWRFYALMGNSVNEASKLSVAPVLGVTFTIDTEGHPVGIHLSDSTSLLASPVRQALTRMPPWMPAYQRGVAVPQGYTFLITYKGGPDDEALLNFKELLEETIRYPFEASRYGHQGVVNIEFSVDAEGKVTDFIALNDLGGCAIEIKRRLYDVPIHYMKALVKNTNKTRFLLPVVFTEEMPYKKNTRTTGSKQFRLPEVFVGPSAPGVEKVLKVRTRESQVIKLDVDEVVRQAKRTKVIQLAEQDLKSLPKQILDVADLRLLDLEKNKLTELPDEIRSLGNLRELYLTNNKIKTLPRTFDDLRRLELLGLSSNELTEFPEEIQHLENLEGLDMSNNLIPSIPEGISSLVKLRTLAFNNNRLTTLPRIIGALSNLKELYLTGNKIDGFPETLRGLSKLDRLALADNDLHQFPKQLLDLDELRILDLWSNKITSIPEFHGRLNNLERLNLGKNQLREFPKSILELGQLKGLDLSYNNITSIPDEISELNELIVLVITGNPIPRAEVEALRLKLKNVQIGF